MYQCILVDFLHKAYSEVDFRHTKISDAIFSGQSLLLSTTILNDMFCVLCVVLKQNGVQGVMYRPDFANAIMSQIVDKCPDVSHTC